jgi:glycosyltransferase involved in cell wall biosynthesis
MRTNNSILICSAYYAPHIGGVERYVELMANYLRREGYEIILLTTAVESAVGKEILHGVTVYRLPVLNFLKQRFPVPDIFSSEYRHMMNELSDRRYSLVILNTRFYCTTLLGLQLSKNAKTILIEHGTGFVKTGNQFLDPLWTCYESAITMYLKRRKNIGFYGVSEACNTWLTHFGIKADGVLYNGIDIPEQTDMSPDTEKKELRVPDFKTVYGLPADAVVFCVAGRLIREKGILFLLDVFTKLSQAYQNAYLFVAGSGPLLEKVISYHASNIHVLGPLTHKELMQLLSFSDIVVIPSDYPEGLPTLLLEAGLHKCAVIATDRGGVREVIVDESLGIVIPDQDESMFYEAMEGLILDAFKREIMTTNLHNRIINNFNWNKNIDTLIHLLEYSH